MQKNQIKKNINFSFLYFYKYPQFSSIIISNDRITEKTK